MKARSALFLLLAGSVWGCSQNETRQQPEGSRDPKNPSGSEDVRLKDKASESGTHSEEDSEESSDRGERSERLPTDLIEAMRKSVLKMARSVGEGEAVTTLTVWKAPGGADIGSEVGIQKLGSDAMSKRVRHLFCHDHGTVLACHFIQPPGLRGHPEAPSQGAAQPPPEDGLDPIAPFASIVPF